MKDTKLKDRRDREPPPKPARITVGWREWVALPDLQLPAIKVKVDTGAKTSAIHAEDIVITRKGDKRFVTFTVLPFQRSKAGAVRVKARLIDQRGVRSSNGKQEIRPVIETTLRVGAAEWPIELTLTRRDVMGFRMLLGREAMRGHILVDPQRSYVTRKVEL